MKKLIGILSGLILLILVGNVNSLFAEEFLKNSVGIKDNLMPIPVEYGSKTEVSYQPDSSFNLLGNGSPLYQFRGSSNEPVSKFSLSLRMNSFKPTLKLKDLESFYAAEYGSGYYDTETYTKLDWEKGGKTSGLGFDFKYLVSPRVGLVFSYDSLKDIEGSIAGAGYDAFLDEVWADADVITIKDIRLLTLGVNYIFTPDKPVKVYVGTGLQKVDYKVVDEWAFLIMDGTTGAILFIDGGEDSDSVSKTGLTFWGGADWYLDDRFFLTFSIRHFDLSNKVDISLDSVKVQFKGLDFTFGAGLSF